MSRSLTTWLVFPLLQRKRRKNQREKPFSQRARRLYHIEIVYSIAVTTTTVLCMHNIYYIGKPFETLRGSCLACNFLSKRRARARRTKHVLLAAFRFLWPGFNSLFPPFEMGPFPYLIFIIFFFSLWIFPLFHPWLLWWYLFMGRGLLLPPFRKNSSI